MAQEKKKLFQPQNFLDLPIRDRVLGLESEVINDPNFFGFDTYALRKGLVLVEAVPSKTTWELEIGSHLCNKSGNLHGGAAATILDNLTSTALLTVAKPGFLDGGHVSRTITMTYLRPVPMGSKVFIECEVQAAGRNTANISGKIFIDGKLCVSCIHDKAVFARNPTAKL